MVGDVAVVVIDGGVVVTDGAAVVDTITLQLCWDSFEGTISVYLTCRVGCDID